MNGKKIFAAMAWLSAGLAAGYLLAQHTGIDFCYAPKDGAHHRHGAERPPLRVKPVPLTKKAAPEPERESYPEKTTQGETE